MGRPVHRAAGALLPVSLNNDKTVTVSVHVVRSSASTLTGKLAGKTLEMMLDSGSAVSLLIKEEADIMKDTLISTPIFLKSG